MYPAPKAIALVFAFDDEIFAKKQLFAPLFHDCLNAIVSVTTLTFAVYVGFGLTDAITA